MGFKKVLNIIELPVVKFSNHSKFSKYELKRTIVFENVSFKFNDEPGRILDNVNLTINKGEKIGIIGETGSGKSTLLDLISVFLNQQMEE